MKTWHPDNSIFIRRGSDPCGELLNMTGGFPIVWNNQVWKSTEALYQAARFPDPGLNHLREDIRHATNGFTAKLIAKKNALLTRED